MKRLTSTAFFIVLSITMFGQAKHSQLESTLQVKAGYNIANISIDNNGNVNKSNQLSSFHAGLICDLPLTQFLSFQGGALLTGKGAKTEFGTPGVYGHYKATTNPMYIEMPLNFIGKIPLGFSKAPKIIVGAGPYLAVGIAGTNNTQFQTPGLIVYSNNDIDFDGGKTATPVGYPAMKRFDYGLNGLAGIELKRLTFSINYDLGFAKLIPGTDDNADNKGKNRVLYFSAGIKL